MNAIKPFKDPIYITRPLLPDLEKVNKKIKEIWDSKWLTNMGPQHKKLEIELLNYLDVDYLSLFCNGTLALQLAMQALKLSGEVITTPFTFPATVNTIYQNKLKPIFCDINIYDFNINVAEIEQLITPNTSAILPVHVFGNPCDVDSISKIAEEYNLKVIYDAAHCFDVKVRNKGIGNFGDVSMFSFHATKIFHTIEGGALTFNNPKLKEDLDLLKNFGIRDVESVLLPGTNAKLNELQAAIGLLNLQIVDTEIQKRQRLYKIYTKNLKNINGITLLKKKSDVKYNYQYFPILIDKDQFRLDRDYIHEKMKRFNVYTRKYFYPLCTDYHFCEEFEKIQIPNARKIANEILCLPIYGELSYDDIDKICSILINIEIA